jgi:transcriptional regulator of acetoin/glycerol metabolism
LHALDPTNRVPSRRLTEGELAAAQERLGQLLRLAQSTLDRLFRAVGGVGCSVLLADGGGIVVDRRGAVADDATFEASGLWTAKFEGTNGIAPVSSKKGRLSSTGISSFSLAIPACFVQRRRFSMSMAN